MLPKTMFQRKWRRFPKAGITGRGQCVGMFWYFSLTRDLPGCSVPVSDRRKVLCFPGQRFQHRFYISIPDMLIFYLLGTSWDVKEEKRAELSIVTPQATWTCAQKNAEAGHPSQQDAWQILGVYFELNKHTCFLSKSIFGQKNRGLADKGDSPKLLLV